jgi:hypothetical protein
MTSFDRTNARTLGLCAALAALVLSLSFAGRGTVQTAPAASAASAGDEVPVKGVVDDPYDTADRATGAAAGAQAKRYSPYAGRKYPTRPLFGDTHLHTSNSGDAFAGGNRLDPEQAYRFARGEEVISSTGVPAKLSRPLDFLVVSDHAEGLGLMQQVYAGTNPAFAADPTLQKWSQGMRAGGTQAADTQNEIVKAQAMGTLPAPVKDPKTVGPIMKSCGSSTPPSPRSTTSRAGSPR